MFYQLFHIWKQAETLFLTPINVGTLSISAAMEAGAFWPPLAPGFSSADIWLSSSPTFVVVMQ